VPTIASRGCVAWSEQRIPTAVNLGFLDRSRYFFFQAAPQLSSRGWVDPVPDPLLLRKYGRARKRTRDLWICSQILWPLDLFKMKYFWSCKCDNRWGGIQLLFSLLLRKWLFYYLSLYTNIIICLYKNSFIICDVRKCSRTILEKLTVAHLITKFPVFGGTPRFITADHIGPAVWEAHCVWTLGSLVRIPLGT
jgi:hypothetical protein